MTNLHVGFAVKPWPPVPCPIPFNTPPHFPQNQAVWNVGHFFKIEDTKLMEGNWHPDVNEIPSRKAPVQIESELLVLFFGTRLRFSSMCPSPRTLFHVSLALAQEFLGALEESPFFPSLITSHSPLAPCISASLSMPHGLPYRNHKEGAPAPQVGAAWRALPKCDSPLHLCPQSHQC